MMLRFFDCSLYGIMVEENVAKGTDEPKHSLFVKAKRGLEMLPPIYDELELHITMANYHAWKRLQADYAILDLEIKPTEPIGWKQCAYRLEIVWKHFQQFQMRVCS